MFFSMLVPGILAAVAITGTVKKVDVYQGLADGAMEGMKILLHILPALVGFIYFRSRVWERKRLVRESSRESSHNK